MTGDRAPEEGSDQAWWKNPRYPYGDMFLFGVFAAVIGYGLADGTPVGGVLGAGVGVAVVIGLIVATVHWGSSDIYRRNRGL